MARKSSQHTESTAPERERVAKVIARAGLASRREAESWIAAGRVKVNGAVLTTPAVTVSPRDRIEVDGAPLPSRERTRLFLYHKPRGLVTTHADPEGRPTIFQKLPKGLPRVVSVGRLDLNSEGLLLLTNDGGLSRALELPSTGWLRRYRVRAKGRTDQATLDRLRSGVTVEGVQYGPIEATLDSGKGANQWLTVGIREGKNREVRKVLAHIGLTVNRLIRVGFGPFELGALEEGAVEEVPTRVLRERLGAELEKLAQPDFAAPLRETEKPAPPRKPARVLPPKRDAREGGRPHQAPRGKPEQFRRESKRSSGAQGAKPQREGERGIRRGGKRTPFRAPKGKR